MTPLTKEQRAARNRWLIEGAAYVAKCRDEDAAIGQVWETPSRDGGSSNAACANNAPPQKS